MVEHKPEPGFIDQTPLDPWRTLRSPGVAPSLATSGNRRVLCTDPGMCRLRPTPQTPPPSLSPYKFLPHTPLYSGSLDPTLRVGVRPGLLPAGGGRGRKGLRCLRAMTQGRVKPRRQGPGDEPYETELERGPLRKCKKNYDKSPVETALPKDRTSPVTLFCLFVFWTADIVNPSVGSIVTSRECQ